MGSMKWYIPVIFAAVLVVIAFVLIVAGVSDLAGLPVLSADSYAFGYLAEAISQAEFSLLDLSLLEFSLLGFSRLEFSL